MTFDPEVPKGGYHWWYIDALSGDGRFGLTIIAFIGSVFSPYYKWARRKGPAEPLNNAAINVAIYAANGHKWAMTERGRVAVVRDRHGFSVGPSRLAWENDHLAINLDEITFPVPGRIRGKVRLHPRSLNLEPFSLDTDALHHWRPIAPTATVEVALEKPALTWRGHGYLDSNWGAVPLETSFRHWDWSRAPIGRGSAVLYEGQRRDGTPFNLALHFAADGRATPFAPPPASALPRTRIWRMPRHTRAEGDDPAAIEKTLEDTPFYARSLLRTKLLGEATTAMHESLDLDRFNLPIVQAMLPFRMPRRRR